MHLQARCYSDLHLLYRRGLIKNITLSKANLQRTALDDVYMAGGLQPGSWLDRTATKCLQESDHTRWTSQIVNLYLEDYKELRKKHSIQNLTPALVDSLLWSKVRKQSDVDYQFTQSRSLNSKHCLCLKDGRSMFCVDMDPVRAVYTQDCKVYTCQSGTTAETNPVNQGVTDNMMDVDQQSM